MNFYVLLKLFKWQTDTADSESDLWLGPLGVIIARGKVVASELDRGPERPRKKIGGPA